MRTRNTRLLAGAAAGFCVLIAAGVAAALVGTEGTTAPPSAAPRESLAEEALEFIRSDAGRATRSVPFAVAREKLAVGKEAGGEILTGPAAEDYSDTALPRQTIDFAQVEAALERAKHFGSHGDSHEADWEEVGPFTLDVAREATQTNGIPTQWSGRVTALAVDPRCDEDDCRLYVGAAGGGVWRTDDALSRRPRWKPLTDSFDTTAVGHLLIDSHDKSGPDDLPRHGRAQRLEPERGRPRAVQVDRPRRALAARPGQPRSGQGSRHRRGRRRPERPAPHPHGHGRGPALRFGRPRRPLHAPERADDRRLRVEGRRRELPAGPEPRRRTRSIPPARPGTTSSRAASPTSSTTRSTGRTLYVGDVRVRRLSLP